MIKIAPETLAAAAIGTEANAHRKLVYPKFDVKPPTLPPGVVPTNLKKHPDFMAMDSQQVAPLFSWAGQFCAGLGFPGYTYLSELCQRSEYRSPSETIANEMTRKWIKLKGTGDGDKTDRIEQLEALMKDLGLRESFRRIAEQDGFFGRSQLYVAIKGQENKRDLPLLIKPETIARDSLLGFRPVEAIWTTPYMYNSVDPTEPDFYKPSAWFILGRRTHASRLMTFVSREVPDILKPAYNFGGLPMTQLMIPYVTQWLRTRDSVSDLIHNFSVMVLSTNMQATLAGDGSEDVFKRIALFNQTRDNRGLMTLDKDSEELTNVATPLSGLSELQAQAQEHMASPSHIPLVKLLGITPSGLNASSEGEIKVFYDYVRAQQENLFSKHLDQVLDIMQLSLFGTIDDEIDYEYVPLDELDGEALARNRKADADSGVAYINAGVVSPDEERERLAADPNSGYNNLTGPAPEPPEPEITPEDLAGGKKPPENGKPG